MQNSTLKLKCLPAKDFTQICSTRYENWVANGEELLTKEDLDTMLILMDTSGENNKLPTHPSIMNH